MMLADRCKDRVPLVANMLTALCMMALLGSGLVSALHVVQLENSGNALVLVTMDGCKAIAGSHAIAPALAASMIRQGLPSNRFMWNFLGSASAARGRTVVLPPARCMTLLADNHIGAVPQACRRGHTLEADVLIVGSSVARGATADKPDGSLSNCSMFASPFSQTCGWGGLLAESLSARGLCVANEAFHGATVDVTAWILQAVLARRKPRIVIFGLSLGNENLELAKTRKDAEAIERHFLRGMRALADEAAVFLGVQRVIIGGVYGKASFNELHADVLRHAADEMLGWPYPVVDFLSHTTDETGHWLRAADGLAIGGKGHPTVVGHHWMYEAIDLDLFDIIR